MQLLHERTSLALDWLVADLVELKRASNTSVSVILPALNEEATVATIVRQIRRELMVPNGVALVDELVVLDSGSTDRTAKVAAAAGATVIHRDDVFPSLPTVTGKGEAMWRGVGATTGELVVFIDADLRSFSTSYVVGLLGPLLTDPDVHLVKAVYERPLVGDRQIMPAGGGRVTELVARPLLNLHWPQLAGVIQPLAGEYAARRSLLEQLPFSCGYGVDFALLIDTAAMHGVRAIAQVDLGVRVHRHHDTARLGRMAAEIMHTAWTRIPAQSPDGLTGLGNSLTQFERDADGYHVAKHDIPDQERPPLANLPEYTAVAAARALPRGSQAPQPRDDLR